ncbi:VWA domain containing CoxE-like protein [Pelotomaculum schinkii]|uniref:VWA domain containing CoxE-like protein n=1 Tax=Pelotomaculum schinkii TaxID=78350 RepID=A0A4Y7R6E8_9FIRM|nr:VWA domain-containing protein [Pelotomaculum schinkii]TEB04515.1 VWA domain containing CoxE-like protein [Pelotomaculum schinkii]
MFINFFDQLKNEGVPVSLNEWLTLMEALAKGLSFSSLTGFYYLARAVLIKNEAHYDRYDLAFAKYFQGLETKEDVIEQALELLESLPDEQPAPGNRSPIARLDVGALRRELEISLKKEDNEQPGPKWAATLGMSPVGHAGFYPGGTRTEGTSLNYSAARVAVRRKYRDFREDSITGVRNFEVALRRLRQLSTKTEGPKDELDLNGTIDATCRNAGWLKLVWERPRRNKIKVILMMDSGGSMDRHMRICTRLFKAAHSATHFKDIKFYYFHNCVYENVYTAPAIDDKDAVQTEKILRTLNSDYRLIIVGDACMAPVEFTDPGGATFAYVEGIKNEPGQTWLKRLFRRFPRSVWINPYPASSWETIHGAETISLIRKIFPMFELTPKGLELAIKKIKR